jgi:hypothetical protein
MRTPLSRGGAQGIGASPMKTGGIGGSHSRRLEGRGSGIMLPGGSERIVVSRYRSQSLSTVKLSHTRRMRRRILMSSLRSR